MAYGHCNSPHTLSIHILDNDSLLSIFYHYRPAIFDGDEKDNERIAGGKGWDRERWWYKLAHVCQRWRNVILGSPIHLGLSLVCTWGMPVADILAHSPPFPLVIEYTDAEENREVTAEDEKGIILALEQRDRVRRIRLQMPVPNLQKLIMAIDEEYQALEYLVIEPYKDNVDTALTFPETFQAPHLRHLALRLFVPPIGSRLLTAAAGLVTFAFVSRHPSTHLEPNIMLQWLSFMPHLETLLIIFLSPVSGRDVERQLTHTLHFTLPNLRWIFFKGVKPYLEALVRRITAPRLEKLIVHFFEQLTFSVPRLLQFMNTVENLRFDSAKIWFSRDGVHMRLYPREKAEMYALAMDICCRHLDWQVSFMAQVFDSHGQLFSSVEHLTIEHRVHSRSTEEHNEVDRTEWHKLLGSLSKVKTFRVSDGLVEEFSRCLRLDDDELPLELLPELQELTYSGSGSANDAFKSFVDARQNAGRPVTVTIEDKGPSVPSTSSN